MKYMGSKNRIAKYIIPILEKEFKENKCIDFIDACVGGANLIDKVNFTNNLFAYDINEYAIELLDAIKNGWEPPLHVSKEMYYDVKKNKDKFEKHIVGYIGINCSFNGKWFDCYASKTITKNGKIRDYQDEARRNLINQGLNLSKINFNHCSIFDLNPKNKSLIYCDVPYKNTKKYKDNFNHDEFYKWCFKMKELGHIIFISEYEMPSEFKEVWSIEIKSTYANNGVKKSVEKLFTI